MWCRSVRIKSHPRSFTCQHKTPPFPSKQTNTALRNVHFQSIARPDGANPRGETRGGGKSQVFQHDVAYELELNLRMILTVSIHSFIELLLKFDSHSTQEDWFVREVPWNPSLVLTNFLTSNRLFYSQLYDSYD